MTSSNQPEIKTHLKGRGVSCSLYFVRERTGPEGVFPLFRLSRKTWANIPSSARLSLSPKAILKCDDSRPHQRYFDAEFKRGDDSPKVKAFQGRNTITRLILRTDLNAVKILSIPLSLYFLLIPIDFPCQIHWPRDRQYWKKDKNKIPQISKSSKAMP